MSRRFLRRHAPSLRLGIGRCHFAWHASTLSQGLIVYPAAKHLAARAHGTLARIPAPHEAAHCAREQGKYWEMHARLFANQGALGLNDLPAHAEALGLDRAAFQTCLESGRYAEAIRLRVIQSAT